MKFLKLLLVSSIVLLSMHCNSEDDDNNIYADCCNTAPLELDFNPGKVYIPNIFSPNFDGLNDYFEIFTDSDIEKVEEYKILNSENDIIFETFNFHPANDGRNYWSPEKEVVGGSYNYTIVVKNTEGNSFEFSGTFCLYRCDAANPFKFTENCGFSNQHSGVGSFDPMATNWERGCP